MKHNSELHRQIGRATPILFALHVFLLGAIAVFSQDASNAVAANPRPEPQSQQEAIQQADSFGSISGKIFRADTGAPLDEAIVTIEHAEVSPTDRQVRRTGPDGAYEFAGLDSGTYTLSVSRTGFTPRVYGEEKNQYVVTSANWIHVGAGQPLNNIDVSLAAGCPLNICPPPQAPNFEGIPAKERWVISGTMRDEDGESLEGEVAAVEVEYLEGGQILDRGGSISTDELGRFEIAGSGSRTIYIAVTAIGARGSAYTTMYYPDAPSLEAAQAFKVSAGTAIRNLNVIFKTVPTYTISGKIVVADASATRQSYGIVIRNLSTDPTGWIYRQIDPAIVRPDGSFTIRSLQAGKYRLIVGEAKREILHGTVYYNASVIPRMGATDVQVSNSNMQVTIPVGGPVEINGIAELDGEPGIPVAGISIGLGLGKSVIVPGPGDGRILDGEHFRLRRIVPGRYTLSLTDSFLVNRRDLLSSISQPVYIKHVECGGVDYTEKSFVIEPGAPLGDCKITLAKNPGTVEGIALDGDKPTPNLVVVLISQTPDLRENPAYVLTTESLADGRFQIAGVIPGDYYLFCVPADKENGYLASQFADKNLSNSTRITIHQGEIATVDLKRFEPR